MTNGLDREAIVAAAYNLRDCLSQIFCDARNDKSVNTLRDAHREWLFASYDRIGALLGPTPDEDEDEDEE